MAIVRGYSYGSVYTTGVSLSVVKVGHVKQGAHLTKPGWSNPIPIPHPTNLALFGHKITLYRFNQGVLILLQGLKSQQGAEPPNPVTLTTGHYSMSKPNHKP